MSDSESEEEFLSADEGDYNDSNQSPIQDEEVDEIMDMIMKKDGQNTDEKIKEDGKSIEVTTTTVPNDRIILGGSAKDLNEITEKSKDVTVNAENSSSIEEPKLQQIVEIQSENKSNEKECVSKDVTKNAENSSSIEESKFPQIFENKSNEKECVSKNVTNNTENSSSIEEPKLPQIIEKQSENKSNENECLSIVKCENDAESNICLAENTKKENSEVEENLERLQLDEHDDGEKFDSLKCKSGSAPENSEKLENKLNNMKERVSTDNVQDQNEQNVIETDKSLECISNKVSKLECNGGSQNTIINDETSEKLISRENNIIDKEKCENLHRNEQLSAHQLSSNKVETSEWESGNEIESVKNQDSNDGFEDHPIMEKKKSENDSDCENLEDLDLDDDIDQGEIEKEKPQVIGSSNQINDPVSNNFAGTEKEESLVIDSRLNQINDPASNYVSSTVSLNNEKSSSTAHEPTTPEGIINKENKEDEAVEQNEVRKEETMNDDDANDEDDNWGDWGNEEMENKETTKVQPKKIQKDDLEECKSVGRQVKKEFQPTAQATSSNDDWGWDSWADDFIVQAAGKVSTFLENVEDQLGIPDPTKMAEAVTKEEKNAEIPMTKANDSTEAKKEMPRQKPSPETKGPSINQSTGVSSWFGGLSSIVQNTGTELVTGGIGALEFIGKKTVDILSEGDPGLRQKRDALSSKKTNSLAAALREAKNNSEKTQTLRTSSQTPSKKQEQDNLKFNDFFEKFQGYAHLDALEMLSSECENKLERILGLQSDFSREDTMKILSETRNNYELSDDDDLKDRNDDFKKELFAATKKLKLKVTCSKLLNTWLKIKEKSTEYSNPSECLVSALSCLAELTSRCVEFHRKVADMLMMVDVQAKELAVERATTLKNISEMFQIELTSLTNTFVQHLAGDSDSNTKKIVTDIYLEGSNCSSMVKDCHDLLLPILQCCVVK